MITLITVTYNAEKTLGRTLQSVEAQTFNSIQHIIMDGGSKDSTVTLAEAYRERVADRYEVTIVSERDNGLYDAMNKSLRIAQGDYICFLNAGDKLHSPSTLSGIDKVADVQKVGVIYGDTDIVDDEGKRIRSRRLTPPEHLTWRSFRSGMLVCHQAFYVNRTIAQQYDTKYRFSADFDWCIRSMKEGERLGMGNIYLKDAPYGNKGEVLADYLSEGMTTANHKASLKERFRIMCNHYGTFTTVLQHLWFIMRTITKK